MGFDLDVSIPAITVFIQGLLSFFSPCVLPMIPLYLGYLSGTSGAASKGNPSGTSGETGASGEASKSRSSGRLILNTLFFALGVSAAFFILGLGLTTLGQFLTGNRLLIARIGGVLIILFGLYQLGVFGKSQTLERERRLPFNLSKLSMSPVTAFLMGFVFSFAWTPCVGPTLSSVLIMATSATSGRAGMLLILVYTLGFIIPLLVIGAFSSKLLAVISRNRNILKYTVKVGAVLLILMGIMMLTGKMNSITDYLSKFTGSSDSTSQNAGEQSGDSGENGTGGQNESGAGSEGGSASEENKDVIPAPDFTLRDQFGNEHSLSDYRGKVVFLNFWATWCPPCRSEMPDIQKLYEKYSADPDSDVVILGVAFPGMGSEKDAEGVAAFLRENGYTYPTVMDEAGDLATAYRISAFPTTFMIDKDGNVFGYVTGAISEEMMESIIQQTIEG